MKDLLKVCKLAEHEGYDLIKMYQKAYYDGTPVITDEQYDALVNLYPQYEDSIGPGGEVPHLNPMFSLRKVYPGRGDTLPDTSAYVKSQKLDGAAIECVYKRTGENFFILDRLVTRGDVNAGKLISHRKHVPLRIPSSFKYESDANFIQVVGEVISTVKVENARNIVSGLINTLDFDSMCEKAAQVGLQFVAYNVSLPDLVSTNPTYKMDMDMLFDLGFKTVLHPISTKPTAFFQTDGIVYRLNDNTEFQNMGYTSKFPRGAFAVKEDADYVVTKLIDVVWATGRTGKVVPTAILEPVEIGGAMVSRATLNNPSFIDAMGLEIGSMVKVIRSGEIIPCIIGLAE